MSEALPKGWSPAAVDDLGQFINGVAFKPTDWGDEGLPIIRIQNLTDPDRKLNRTQREVPEIYRIDPGEILVSWSATLDAFVWRGPTALLNQHIFRFIPEERLAAKRFAFYLLRFAIARMEESEHTHGSTMHHINRGPFLAWDVALPPLSEQHRIVAAIELQLSRVDAGVEALERVRKELARYRASVLKAACEGRLVPTEASLARAEGRSYEPASALLARILAERRARWEASNAKRAKMYPEPAPPDDSALAALPEGWCWSAMDQLLNELRNGVSTVPREESGVPILRISAVRALRVDLSNLRFLSGSKADFEGYEVAAGDLLFTRYNGSTDLVGVCACAPDPGRFVAYPDKIIRGRVGTAVSNSYLAIAANTGTSRAHIEARTRTTAGQAGVSGSDIKAMPIPLPPLAEQHRIVAEVERRLSIADAVAASVDAALARAARLRQSILKRAFEGKLVPQDPNDEPASVLLARIRAEREKAVSAKPTRRAKGGVR